ncbi:putative phospholipase/carboxylesterase [Bifidobacterium magnum]|uniref:Putative phospholipase/carboxylesterase n=2 Tax=Bifidobacterium magnum TaxID=1692 RepID=A0A087BA04_9BIFI|nr:hypothetical protein [Bifidobacterium magnum]KFI67854.1 putative phospholipase/carboxylesterase [Bifidobacterium magnum]
MQLNATIRLNTTTDDPRTYLMFHGYGNNETSMERILTAIYQHNETQPSYLSFQALPTSLHRRIHLVRAQPQRRSTPPSLRQSRRRPPTTPAFATIRTPQTHPHGLLQGAYLCYRLTQQFPDLFDTAVMLSPAFKEEYAPATASNTRYILCYGDEENHIPEEDQNRCMETLQATGNLTLLTYAGMGHAVCTQEINDLRELLTK